MIDEILAVGDVNFQAKCFEKLREIKKSGVTIVLVTHDSGTVEWFCDRAIWINQGFIEKDGKSTEVVDSYMRYMSDEKVEHLENQNANVTGKEKEQTEIDDATLEKKEIVESKRNENRIGTREAEITYVEFRDKNNKVIIIPRNGEKLSIHIKFNIKEIKPYVFGIGIFTLEGVRIFGTNTQLDHYEMTLSSGNGALEIVFDSLELIEGIYMLQVAITDDNGALIDFHRDYLHFNVAGRVNEVGIVSMKHRWNALK